MKILIFIAIIFLILFNNRGNVEVAEVEEVATEETTETIHVDVAGAVTSPGLYELPVNSYTGDAIELAGGYSSANESCINLAHKLSDGEKIYVPTSEEECVEIELININTATVEELDTLPGIGETKAQNIVDYREANGFFITPEDIMNVEGIGESIYEDISEMITI